MKLDTQGLELPVLKSAGRFLEESIWIETETGLAENYENETTFDQILPFMNAAGFGLFGINPNHSVSRQNRLAGFSWNEQLLWCEAVWLRDYRASSREALARLTRAKALRALCLYANHGCISFGLEAAALFRDLGLITGAEFDAMERSAAWWALPRPGLSPRWIMRALLYWVPRRFLGTLQRQAATLTTVLNGLQNSDHPLVRKAKQGR